MDYCSECARNCFLIHQQKKKHESAVTSFFKVMFSDKYSELMFLPPKFAATVKKLVNQEISLEDVHGLRWPVTISIVDGSLAFKRGWNAFFMGHGLVLGDFIFFFYLRSHFVVKIYDRSGCEKLDFPKSNLSKKRTRSSREYVPRVEPSKPDDSYSTKSKVGRTSFSSKHSREEDLSPVRETIQRHSDGRCQEKHEDFVGDWLSAVVTRNTHNEDTRLLFDLSNFEKNSTNLCGNGSKGMIKTRNLSKEFNNGGDKLENEGTLADQSMIGKFKVHAIEETGYRVALKQAGCSGSIPLHTKNAAQYFEPQVSNSTAMVEARKTAPGPLNWGIKDHSKKIDACATFSALQPCKMEPFGGTDLYSQPSATVNSNFLIAGKLKTLKMEPEDGISNTVDILSSPDYSKQVTGIAHDPSYLELPSRLAVAGRFGNGRKVIVLKDPQKRLWPVMYHEGPYLTGMVSGWKAFCQANQVQPGDECAFKLEDVSDCLYGVSINRRPKLPHLPPPTTSPERGGDIGNMHIS
ncbi:hypothetical protein SAY87_019104 [Trapa incisa]|uniref:TF-B3 domain-containing protein n=1 Tax=Trapa incisa TaxID=236973 RepID=A0AAN7Q1W1_9MYRT|nr:hypothetical protein SAY87_019104 [Trapa incisa]